MSCDRKIGVFDCCSVVQGDCLELLKLLPDGSVDAVVTDPPYGVNHNTDYSKQFGPGTSTRIYPRVHGDGKPFDPAPWLKFPIVVMFGANVYSHKLPKGAWLIWDKRNKDGSAFLADGEAAWMNKGYGIYIESVTSQGLTRPEPPEHPTQKPVALMAWCIEKAGNPGTILDPYCGSGTTLVAAKKLGRHFLGFEISPEYCEIARKRIALVEAQPNLFAPKPEQQPLEGL